MMNYKVRVANEAESKEVQGWFEELGFDLAIGEETFNRIANKIKAICVTDGKVYVNTISFESVNSRLDELTIPQLRDMVVLHRNDVRDANCKDDTLHDLYIDSNKVVYFYHHGKLKWVESAINGHDVYLNMVKPTEKEMKEYLVLLEDGSYVLNDLPINEESIEVPEGADTLAGNKKRNRQRYFWNHTKGAIIGTGESLKRYPNWEDFKSTTAEQWLKEIDDNDFGILWQRNPPVDAEFKGNGLKDIDVESILNERSIEETLKERQGQYGDFKFVANTTGQLMAVVLNSANGKTLPYMHEEALHMIFSKIARLVNGDYNHIDGWHDIAGYATLIENELKKKQK